MAKITDPENTVIIEMEDGNVTIELLPDVAPKHVKRMKDLARSGHYDNVAFHRVVAGFMAQTGDVQNGVMDDSLNLQMAGTGGSSLPNISAEFSDLVHDRGTVAAARSQNLNSANSQFFINYSENHFLNGQYTIYGRVISGIEHIDSLAPGEPPNTPGRMISMKVVADQNLPTRKPINKTKKLNKAQVVSKPSNNDTQSDQPQSLPIYILPMIAAFPYYMIVIALGVFDFFGINSLSSIQRFLCMFVAIGISAFGSFLASKRN